MLAVDPGPGPLAVEEREREGEGNDVTTIFLRGMGGDLNLGDAAAVMGDRIYYIHTCITCVCVCDCKLPYMYTCTCTYNR